MVAPARPNKFIEKDEYYEIIIYDKNTLVKAKVKIDKQDYKRVRQYKWCIDSEGYVSCSKVGRLHRFVMKCRKGEDEIDHVKIGKLGKLDNRKDFLRKVTRVQNTVHRGNIRSNTSGYKGVRFNTREGKWKAYTTIDNKHTGIGTFTFLRDAVIAYNKFMLALHGKYAVLNDVPESRFSCKGWRI